MFSGQAAKYEEFRAKFKIWIPTLETLDGTDFSKMDPQYFSIQTFLVKVGKIVPTFLLILQEQRESWRRFTSRHISNYLSKYGN